MTAAALSSVSVIVFVVAAVAVLATLGVKWYRNRASK